MTPDENGRPPRPRFRTDHIPMHKAQNVGKSEAVHAVVRQSDTPTPGRALDVLLARELLGVEVEGLTPADGSAARFYIQVAAAPFALVELPALSTDPGACWRYLVPAIVAHGYAVGVDVPAPGSGDGQTRVALIPAAGTGRRTGAHHDTVAGAVALAAYYLVRSPA